jgi:hypothetical protein
MNESHEFERGYEAGYEAAMAEFRDELLALNEQNQFFAEGLAEVLALLREGRPDDALKAAEGTMK